MSEPYLKMVGISKTFPGVKALDSVNFEVAKGEVHGLLGENGAGKSTLIKILTGAYKKDDGHIYINNREVNISNPRQAIDLGIAAIYQELNLSPYLSVAENIFLGREFKSKSIVKLVDWKKTKIEAAKIIK